MDREKVLLASLPLSSPHYPSLALALLKPALAGLGIRADVRYFSLDYVETIGSDAFECLADTGYYTALIGEWVFAPAAYGTEAGPGPAERRFLSRLFKGEFPEHDDATRRRTILAARAGAADFIARCVASVDWRRYAVIGVSTSFQQNMASLAFARQVKARHPEILVVFGGANCQGEMGEELHRRFPFVDAVCLGEGERVFPELVRRHLAGEDLAGLPGVMHRDANGGSVKPLVAVDRVENLDALPYPDLGDFYRQRARAPRAAAAYPPAVVFESARGCWWGAKHHCTFCGLNGSMMSYRSKSPERAYAELAHLTKRYGREVMTADAILDLRYFETLLPRLAAEGPRLTLFWQMKANLRPEQLTLLARAGVKRIQPGIEALDSELLRLMNKGCTMLQNVQLLKLAAENGLSVAWNLLYGFPGADPDVYARSAAIIPKLRHLQPPQGAGRVLADRFSPYFQRPQAFGVRLEPAASYASVYKFEPASVARFAYHFHMRSEALDRIERDVAPLLAEQRLWAEHQRRSALYCAEEGGALVVTDRRWGWPRTRRRLGGADAALLRLCWRMTPSHAVAAELGPSFGTAALAAAAARLEALGWILREGEELLALPLRQPGWRRAPTVEEALEGDRVAYALREAPPLPRAAA